MDLKTASDFLRATTDESDLYHALCNNVDRLFVQPSQMHPATTTFHELPEELARANDYKEHRLPMGLFPLIDRAWAFVQRGLFIWQPGNLKEKPIELLLNYQEDVRCVEIVPPKENIFSENLMVMCSSKNVSLYKVLTVKGTRQGVFFSDVPHYKCSTGGRSITAVTGTKNGRIFLGTECGRLYELWYSSKEGIAEKASKCQLICCSWALLDYLPQTVVGYARAITQIVVDEERGILYARHQDSHVEVFHLGDDLQGRVIKVGECLNLLLEALRANGSANANIKHCQKLSLASIATIPTGVSRVLHLEGVTTSGIRLYFTTWGDGQNDIFFGKNVAPRGEHPKRPSALRALFAAQIPVVSNTLWAHRGRVPATFDMITTNGTSAFSQSCEQLNAQTEIHLLEPPRNSPGHFQTAYHGAVATSRGTARALASIPQKIREDIRWYFDEVGDSAPPESAQFFATQPIFRVLTTTGSMDVEVHQPATLIRNALQGGHRKQLAQLVEMYGGRESAALLVHVGTDPQSDTARDQALAALTETSRHEAEGKRDGALVVRSEFSERIRIELADVVAGTKAYVHRWLKLIWGWNLFEEVRLQGDVCATRVAVKKDVIEWYKRQCKGTAELIDNILEAVPAEKEKNPKGHQTQREKLAIELEAIGYLVQRAGHVMSILDIVSKRSLNDLPCLAHSRDREAFVSLTFDDVVSDQTPDCSIQRLIFDMVVMTDEQPPDLENIPAIHANGMVANESPEPEHGRNKLMEEFEGKASSFFGASEREIILAYEVLKGGAREPFFSRETEVEAAVSSFLQHPAAIILEPICHVLALREKYQAMSTVCLAAAQARDPQHLAFNGNGGDECSLSVNAAARRQPCYDKIIQGIGALLSARDEEDQLSEQSIQHKLKLNKVLQICTHTFDPILFKQLFDYMGSKNRLTDLLEVRTMAFTRFLANLAGIDLAAQHRDLDTLSEDQHTSAIYLAQHFALTKNFEKSGRLFWRLARRQGALAIHHRAELIKRAVELAKELGDASVLDEFEDGLEVAEIQMSILHGLTKLNEGAPEMERLRNNIVPIHDLLDVYAKPHEMHPLCIRCLALLCDYPNRARELMFHWRQFTHSTFTAKQHQGFEAQVRHLCAAMVRLGSKIRADFDTVGGCYACIRLEWLVFKAIQEITPSTEIPRMSEEHKQMVFETMLKACKGCVQICFRVYHSCVEFIVEDTSECLAFKLDMFRSCLMISEKLVPELQASMKGVEGRDLYEMEIMVNQFIRAMDEFSVAARHISPGEDSMLLDLYSRFDTVRRDLREAINSRKPLFLRDPGFVAV